MSKLPKGGPFMHFWSENIFMLHVYIFWRSPTNVIPGMLNTIFMSISQGEHNPQHCYVSYNHLYISSSDAL